MTRVAVIILSRNLPERTDALVEKFRADDFGQADVFVVESGSSLDRMSKYCTWRADWPEAVSEGLRYPRGFNYGLLQLMAAGKFDAYEHFFLVCNDADFDGDLVPVLVNEMDAHPRVGILMPCATNWAERDLIGANSTRYVCHGSHIAWMLRRSFVERIMERRNPDVLNLLYDGTNFRGYYADQELIVKGYVNEFATAITTKAMIWEETELLKTRSDLIRTERYEANQRMVFEEGAEWMRRKYGFTTRMHFSIYANQFFDRFFQLYPQLACHRI